MFKWRYIQQKISRKFFLITPAEGAGAFHQGYKILKATPGKRKSLYIKKNKPVERVH